MGFASRAFLAGGLGFAAAFVVACGSSNGLLSADQSSTLSAQLNSISSALAAHRCDQVSSAVTALNNAVANLPSSVNSTLLSNLGQGASTVSDLASRECTTTSSAPSNSSTSSTSTTPTTSSSTSSSSTSTSTSTSTPSSSTSTSTSTATNPAGTGTSSTATTSNGGAGISTTATAGG